MKTLINTFQIVILITLFSGCGKEELSFNPEINKNSEFEELLSTTSFFDRKETTFIITEEEYDRLIISRDSASFVFKMDEIFENLSQYTHVTYPYFSESTELFFMGKLSELNESDNQISFKTEFADYDDLFDNYLINTSLPNGYANTRNEKCTSISSNDFNFVASLQSQIEGVVDEIYKNLIPGGLTEFTESNELSASVVGEIKGCINLIKTPTIYGVRVEDFSLNNFGIQVNWAEPSTNFPTLKQELLTSNDLEIFPGIFETMSSAASSTKEQLFEKTVIGAPLSTGFPLIVSGLVGYDSSLSGDVFLSYLNNVSTTKDLDLEIIMVDDEVAPVFNLKESGSNLPTTKKFEDYLQFKGDSFVGAKAAMSLEILGGFAFADLANTNQIGLLLGVEGSTELTGKIGQVEVGNNSNYYMEGCGSLSIKGNYYLYGQIGLISNNLSFLPIPNVYKLWDETIYNIATDPTFVGNDNTINYDQKICWPDNCKDIVTGLSYIKFTPANGDNFNVSYEISSNSDDIGKFQILLKHPAAPDEVLLTDFYNTAGSSTVSIPEPFLTQLGQQETTNISVIVKDDFSGCEKTMPTILFDKPCEGDHFEDGNTGLVLRKYNLDIQKDLTGLSGCYKDDDPIYSYLNAGLTEAHSFDPGYDSWDYMSYENCKCWAEKLEGNYEIPKISSISSFMSANSNLDYSLVNGNNSYCSNFLGTGYMTGAGGICNEILTLNLWSASGSLQPVDGLCITSFSNSYFHVDNEGTDALNQTLFEVFPNGDMNLKTVPKGILAPCRLQKIN